MKIMRFLSIDFDIFRFSDPCKNNTCKGTDSFCKRVQNNDGELEPDCYCKEGKVNEVGCADDFNCNCGEFTYLIFLAH